MSSARTLLRLLAAGVSGFVLGSLVNLLLVTTGSKLIPAPAGINVNDVDAIAAGIHLFGPEHFVFPFLAHAAGTFVAAFVAYMVATQYRIVMAWLLGVLNLMGGIAAASMIPAPVWFIAVDLLLAYLPMAYAAIILGRRLRPETAPF